MTATEALCSVEKKQPCSPDRLAVKFPASSAEVPAPVIRRETGGQTGAPWDACEATTPRLAFTTSLACRLVGLVIENGRCRTSAGAATLAADSVHWRTTPDTLLDALSGMDETLMFSSSNAVPGRAAPVASLRAVMLNRTTSATESMPSAVFTRSRTSRLAERLTPLADTEASGWTPLTTGPASISSTETMLSSGSAPLDAWTSDA